MANDQRTWDLKDARILYQNALNRAVDIQIACKKANTTEKDIVDGAKTLAHTFFEYVMKHAEFYVDNGCTPLYSLEDEVAETEETETEFEEESKQEPVEESEQEPKKRGRGRPKGSGKKVASKKVGTGKRGRPKGSTNKPKPVVEEVEEDLFDLDGEASTVLPVPTENQLDKINKIVSFIVSKGKNVSTLEIQEACIDVLDHYPKDKEDAKKVIKSVLS